MEQSLKQAINDLLKSYNLDEKLNEVRLRASWEGIMGKTIARHTTDMFIKNKKLHIRFDSAPLKSELLYAKTKVIKMLNDKLGEDVLEEIIFL